MGRSLGSLGSLGSLVAGSADKVEPLGNKLFEHVYVSPNLI